MSTYGHSELVIPTECAVSELLFDTSFKTVQYSIQHQVEWPFEKMELKRFTLLGLK